MRCLFIIVCAMALAGMRGEAVRSPAGLAQTGTGIDVAAYFPIRKGDAWTYDWQFRAGKAPPQTVKRTRAFEDRELAGARLAHKLASETGDYAFFSLDETGLYLHGAAERERDIRFVFDPPIPLLTPQMKVGQFITTTQLSEDGQTTRRFSSGLAGQGGIETPMGRFDECLKVVWTMDDNIARQTTTYFLAKGVGVVAYQIEVQSKREGGFEMSVDARLRLAQLQGRNFSKAEELKASVALAAITDNAKARALFRRASESLYVWDRKFPGFEATFTLRKDGAPLAEGTVTVNRRLETLVTCPVEAARSIAQAEIGQFVGYRRATPFDEAYGKDKARIDFIAGEQPEAEIVVNDEESGLASFVVRDREIVRISRSHGRVRFVINHVKSLRTDDGRFLPIEAELTYYSNETGAVVSRTTYLDRHEKLGSYWLLVARRKVESVGDKTSTLELVLSNIRYAK
jgi:hypothetical protein